MLVGPCFSRMRVLFSIALLTLHLELVLFECRSAEPDRTEQSVLHLPTIGSSQLSILAPTVLELTFITTQKPGAVQVEQWNFVNEHGDCRLPPPEEFLVSAGDTNLAVTSVGLN